MSRPNAAAGRASPFKFGGVTLPVCPYLTFRKIISSCLTCQRTSHWIWRNWVHATGNYRGSYTRIAMPEPPLMNSDWRPSLTDLAVRYRCTWLWSHPKYESIRKSPPIMPDQNV